MYGEHSDASLLSVRRYRTIVISRRCWTVGGGGTTTVAIVVAQTTMGWTNYACNLHCNTCKVTWSKVVYFNHLQVHPSPAIPSPSSFLNHILIKVNFECSASFA